jgi:hypothetical protein
METGDLEKKPISVLISGSIHFRTCLIYLGSKKECHKPFHKPFLKRLERKIWTLSRYAIKPVSCKPVSRITQEKRKFLKKRKLLAASPENSGKEFSSNGFFWLWVFDVCGKT